MATTHPSTGPDRARATRIAVAGVAIILLGAGAALLPSMERLAGNQLVGWLLLAAGAVEILAGTQRHETKLLAMLAGAATTVAGLMFVLNPVTHFLPTISIVTVWLFVRSLILVVTCLRAHGRVRAWLALSAITDFMLGVLLLIGLSISTLIVVLFGPTEQVVATFAWVFAISFVVTGGTLLEVASCERRSDRDESVSA